MEARQETFFADATEKVKKIRKKQKSAIVQVVKWVLSRDVFFNQLGCSLLKQYLYGIFIYYKWSLALFFFRFFKTFKRQSKAVEINVFHQRKRLLRGELMFAKSRVAKMASVCKRRKKDSLLTIFTKLLCDICRNSIECKRFARQTKIISFLAEFV